RAGALHADLKPPQECRVRWHPYPDQQLERLRLGAHRHARRVCPARTVPGSLGHQAPRLAAEAPTLVRRHCRRQASRRDHCQLAPLTRAVSIAPASVPALRVTASMTLLTGLEVVLRDPPTRLLQSRAFGLVSNQASVSNSFAHAADALHERFP